MPEKVIIGISVEKKIAKADENAVIVCANSNYKAVFAFDGEWADYPIKTAIFATDNTDDNKPIAVVFNGNECDIPPLSNTTIVGVGVVSGDLTVGDQVEVSTTTPAYIPCLISIKDLGGVIAPPAPDVYDQIIALLNKYIQQGGGGSGGTDEERVREIVAEETADLQGKTDEGLETESKQVVGAINELNEKKVGFTDYGSKEKAGVYKVGGGLWSNQYTGVLGIDPATEYIIDKRAYYYPLNPHFLDYAVMSALADCRKPEHWTDENKANACETIGAANKPYVDDRFAIIDTVLEQSGLVSKYKATIEDTYNERVTADGANVLDGSKAKLEKVVGSTVACKNLLNISNVSWTSAQPDVSGIKITDISENVITVASGTEYNSDGNVMIGNTLAELCPNLRVGETYYLNADVVGDNVDAVIYLRGAGPWSYGYAKEITQDMLNATVAIRGSKTSGVVTISNLRITKEQNTSWQPYFTGLKSASFGGIESTNADGTETATLAFPKTETPLGVTIDFENKKITDYGVEIVCDIDFVNNASVSRNGTGFILNNVLPYEESNNRIGVSSINYPVGVASGNRIIVSYTGGAKNILFVGLPFFTGYETSNNDDFRNWLKDLAQAGTPLIIRYVSSTLQSETDFTADNEYTAYNGGTEKVLDNDGKDYGADNTLSQNYIIVTGVK